MRSPQFTAQRRHQSFLQQTPMHTVSFQGSPNIVPCPASSRAASRLPSTTPGSLGPSWFPGRMGTGQPAQVPQESRLKFPSPYISEKFSVGPSLAVQRCYLAVSGPELPYSPSEFIMPSHGKSPSGCAAQHRFHCGPRWLFPPMPGLERVGSYPAELESAHSCASSC